MPRSASTWLYNAVRLLSEQAGGEVSAGWIEDLCAKAPPACEDLIVKIHTADPKLAAQANFIFTSRRDLRDVGASIRDMGWAKSDKGILRQVAKARRAHGFWSARADLDLDYRDMLTKPFELIGRIAAVLRIPVDAAAVGEIDSVLNGLAADPSRMTEQHDALTLMHATHRFDGRAGSWRDRLSREAARRIEEEHRDWLSAFGYLTPKPKAVSKKRAKPKAGRNETTTAKPRG